MKDWLGRIGVFVVIIGCIGYLVFPIIKNVFFTEPKKEPIKPAVIVEKPAVEVAIPNEQVADIQEDGDDDAIIAVGAPENDVILFMHKMTHQKVIAEAKRGAIEMTPENIELAYQVVSQSDYEYKKEMLEILTRWKDGNFKNVVNDHNFFWNLHDGNLGKATGVMSAEGEAQFIENNFRN